MSMQNNNHKCSAVADVTNELKVNRHSPIS